MLWVISGFAHSGKRTFRDLLAKNYGFQVIEKYVLENTAGLMKQVLRRFQNGSTKDVAQRDSFLCIPGKDDSRRTMLEQISSSEITDEKREEIKQSLKGDLIYDKNGKDYYVISCEKIKKAFNESATNYLLVCSDTSVISQIRDVSGFEPEKMRTILIFGMNINLVVEHDKAVKVTDDAKKKLSQYLDAMSTNSLFDYIIYNQRIDSPQQRNRNLLQQFENLLAQEKQRASDVHCYKLNTKINNHGRHVVQPCIFFIKPFSKGETKEEREKSRATKIFQSINWQIKDLIKNTSPIPYAFADNSEKYYIGGDSFAAQIVDYDDNKPYPQDKMTKQIEEANLIIADVADFVGSEPVHNINCYWELGYARAKGKDVIVMVDKKAINSVPFDERNSILFQYEYRDGKVIFLDEAGQKTNTFKARIEEYLKRICEAANERAYNYYLLEES